MKNYDLELEPLGRRRSPAYCSEKLTWHECKAKVKERFATSVKDLYDNVYNNLVNGELKKLDLEQ